MIMKDISRYSKRVQKMYKRYWGKLIFRCVLFGVILLCYVLRPEDFEVLHGLGFFHQFSSIHIVWLLWLWYMVEKMLPFPDLKPKGSMKYLRSCYQEAPQKDDKAWRDILKEQIKTDNKRAGLVLVCWGIGIMILYLLLREEWIQAAHLFLLSCLFYIGDLVCILIWCPFRSIFMKNKCCTQCRIYNWDTIFLIVPLLLVPGFYSHSLGVLALVNVGIWEVTRIIHPERYYAISNAMLQCRNCKGELGCVNLRLLDVKITRRDRT